MYLAVDNSTEQVVLYYFIDNQWIKREYERAETGLLESIDQLLKEVKKNVGELKGLAVIVGQGRFTPVRVATTVVNTLAYALQIPVIALTDMPVAGVTAEQIKNTPVGQYVTPKYSGEARIGKSG